MNSPEPRRVTLLVSDVCPAIGSATEQPAGELFASIGRSNHPAELPATALLVETRVDDRVLPPLAATVARWIAAESAVATQPLGRLLPDLERSSGSPADADHLSAEARGVLSNAKVDSWAALASFSYRDLASRDGASEATAEEAVALAVREAGHQALALLPAGIATAERSLRSALAVVAGFALGELGQHTVADALEAISHEEELPAEVIAARDRLLGTPLSNLAGQVADRYDTHAALARLARFDERTRSVVVGRVYPVDKRRTLDDLGTQMGITRERVRQIETRAKELVEARLEDTGCAPVLRAAARLRRRLRVCTALTRLPAELSKALGLSGDSGDEQQGLELRMLLAIAGPYEIYEDWLVQAPSSELVRTTAEAVLPRTEGEFLKLEAAAEALREAGIPDADHEEWIERACRCRVVEGSVVPWYGSMADKTERVLVVRGEPMTVEELAEALGPNTNTRSFLGQVQGDVRFLRRGKKHYGLSAWGGEEYTKIEDEIAQEIERQGGPCTIDHLVETLCEQFGVSEASVRAYAASPPFVRLSGGEVALGADDTRVFERRAMAHSRGCFIVDGEWALRVPVDRELLRGSGRLAPIGVLQHLGISPGASAALITAHGEINLRWGRQPQMGSLRPLANAHHCHEGDLLFLQFVEGLRCECHVVRSTELEAREGLERLAAEVGLTKDSSDLLGRIGAALDLPEEERTVPGIRRRLRSRQEEHLVALLPEEAPVGDDHDAVLRQIMGLGAIAGEEPPAH